MAYLRRTLWLALVLFCANLTPTTSDCNAVFDETYYVAHKATHQVISGFSYNEEIDLIALDPSYVASFYNTWIMYPAPRPGLFFITIKCCMYGVLGFNRETSDLVLDYNTDSIYQQWFFDSDGRIVNGGAFNYGLRVNRTGLSELDLYVGFMGNATDDDIFEFVLSPWTPSNKKDVNRNFNEKLSSL